MAIPKAIGTNHQRIQHLMSRIFTLIAVLTVITLMGIQNGFAQKKSHQKVSENYVERKIVLASNETSQYTIVIPVHATPHELKAAQVLQD